ncbi:MAG: hypothetical protein ACI8TQ_003326 [Planctomycetota bacterium]|jgi:hypothetical protein
MLRVDTAGEKVLLARKYTAQSALRRASTNSIRAARPKSLDVQFGFVFGGLKTTETFIRGGPVSRSHYAEEAE